MLTAASLSTIIALARAGALDHAWYEFRAGGWDARDDDPAALTVKGRLLKDRALRASGEERRRLYLESSRAYRRSAELLPATYPLINAATLSLLSGDRDQAQEIAREVLARIEREPDEPETPYWRAATEAEALLLLGRADEARTALEAALAAAPRAWEDHGSTLRQFELIHEALDADPAWLDLLRPPRSLGYAGRFALREGGQGELGEAIGEVLERQRIGFGYGGLSAGAELVAAEALLTRGAELHAVLPGDPESFAAVFVDPFGDEWRRRFDAALAAAETVEHVRPLGTPASEAIAALADQVALGAALLNAERLMSAAVQLRFDPDLPATARWPVLTLALPESAQPIAAPEPDDSRLPLLALLALGVGSSTEAGFEARLEDVRQLPELAGAAAIAPHLSGDAILIGYESPLEAAAAARGIHARLRGRMPLRIAGHYGLVACVRDPFTGALKPTESGAAIAREIARAIPADTLCVSGDFAAVLSARASAPGEASWIGELEAKDGGSPVALYALSRGQGS